MTDTVVYYVHDIYYNIILDVYKTHAVQRCKDRGADMYICGIIGVHIYN